MRDAAAHEELRAAFETHLQETREHVSRLDEIFGELGLAHDGTTCHGMEGLLQEGQEMIKAQGDPTVRDAALIAAAQRVEHYEIAAYGTLRTLASELENDHAEGLLDSTLDEEGRTDKLLTKIATGGMFKSGLNQQAAR